MELLPRWDILKVDHHLFSRRYDEAVESDETPPPEPIARKITEAPRQTVIFFDWDDTLLCTNFLETFAQDSPLTVAAFKHICAIEIAARQLLQLSQRLGQTIIVTNSMDGWVFESAAKWAPSLLPLLKDIPIFYTRNKDGPKYPGSPETWKIQAFHEALMQIDVGDNAKLNLISVGDSELEMTAARATGQSFAKCLMKTVKLQEKPSDEELQKQLELVLKKFAQIVEKECDLTIHLNRKRAGDARPPRAGR